MLSPFDGPDGCDWAPEDCCCCLSLSLSLSDFFFPKMAMAVAARSRSPRLPKEAQLCVVCGVARMWKLMCSSAAQMALRCQECGCSTLVCPRRSNAERARA